MNRLVYNGSHVRLGMRIAGLQYVCEVVKAVQTTLAMTYSAIKNIQDYSLYFLSKLKTLKTGGKDKAGHLG